MLFDNFAVTLRSISEGLLGRALLITAGATRNPPRQPALPPVAALDVDPLHAFFIDNFFSRGHLEL
jgi:hypothetical protein